MDTNNDMIKILEIYPSDILAESMRKINWNFNAIIGKNNATDFKLLALAQSLKDRIEAIKDKVVESIEDTKDFLEGLVRGDISGRTREEDGAADAGRGSPVLRPAFAGEESAATADVIREARDAVRNARADSGDTESVIQESKSKADSSTAERADRDAERERLEAERAELDGEQDYWDDFEDRGSRGGRW